MRVTLVAFEVDSQAALLTLTNGAGGNLLNGESLEALQAAVSRASADPDVRAVVLRSEGGPFCLGMDLGLLQAAHADPELGKRTVALYVDLLSSIQASPKPVIALVQGAVKAGGIGLAGACDIVLAADSATFEFSEVILGLIPANVIPFLAGVRVPVQTLKHLVLTARTLSAREALRLNLADEVFPEDQLAAGAKAVLKAVFRASPRALAETKRFFGLLAGEDRERVRDLAQAKLLELIRDPEVLQAIRAWQDGMTPAWFAKYRPERPLVLKEGT
jgi:enoyl-CoA hydratase/carnithine racemase